jgi:hypothetical protein
MNSVREDCMSNFELRNNLSICLKTEETLCRDGRSQNHPDLHWLLASSPAGKSILEISKRFPNICVVALLRIRVKFR